MNSVSILRLYGGAIGVVSGLYAISIAGAELFGSMEALGIGGWAMLVVGVVVLIHGILLFTPVGASMGRISGPLMLLWAIVMVGNQILMATTEDWRMSGNGMGMEGGASNSVAWDLGMVAIGVLMFISGLIMVSRRSGDSI